MARSKESNRGYQGSESISVDDFRAGLRSGEIEILPLSEPIKQKAEASQTPEGQITLAEARELLGDHLIGPEQVERVWRTRALVPALNLTRQELQAIKDRKEYLILRTDKLNNSTPLTGLAMHEHLKDRFNKQTPPAVPIYEIEKANNWKSQDPAFTTETPNVSWAIVSSEPVEGTLNQNFIDQTDTLITELREKVYKRKSLPPVYEQAIAQYEKEKPEIIVLAKSPEEIKWKEASRRLSELAITKLLRPSTSETLYDLFTIHEATGVYLLSSLYTLTRSLSSGGRLVGVGHFDARGVHGGRWEPLNALGNLGASFSRSPR